MHIEKWMKCLHFINLNNSSTIPVDKSVCNLRMSELSLSFQMIF